MGPLLRRRGMPRASSAQGRTPNPRRVAFAAWRCSLLRASSFIKCHRLGNFRIALIRMTIDISDGLVLHHFPEQLSVTELVASVLALKSNGAASTKNASR